MGRKSGAARKSKRASASPVAHETPATQSEKITEYEHSERQAQWDVLSNDFAELMGKIAKLRDDPRMSAERRKKFEMSYHHLASAAMQALLAYADPSNTSIYSCAASLR